MRARHVGLCTLLDMSIIPTALDMSYLVTAPIIALGMSSLDGEPQ
jgi:hypothetical protein